MRVNLPSRQSPKDAFKYTQLLGGTVTISVAHLETAPMHIEYLNRDGESIACSLPAVLGADGVGDILVERIEGAVRYRAMPELVLTNDQQCPTLTVTYSA